MFEFKGLDQVNWRALKSSFGNAEKVPELLRELANSRDENFVEQAFEKLFDQICYQDVLTGAVSATVPFLVQLLDKDNFPKRRWILDELIDLLESCDESTRFATEIRMLKEEAEIFVSVERDIPKSLALLKDSDEDIRLQAAYLLTLLKPQQPRVRLKLWRASEVEKNLFVQAAMISGVGKLIKLSYGKSARRVSEHYHMMFQSTMTSATKPVIRLAAALAWIDSHPVFSRRIRDIPPIVFQILGESLVSEPLELPFDMNVLSAFFSNSIILEHLRRLGAGGMAQMLQIEEMTYRAAHVIARELLETVFARIRANYLIRTASLQKLWTIYEPWGSHDDERYFYSYHEQKTGQKLMYIVDKPLGAREQLVIKAIVNCDPFWQIPTNLFSFFYGLPDLRDELRALLAKQP